MSNLSSLSISYLPDGTRIRIGNYPFTVEMEVKTFVRRS
jgi:hypothetical protein